MLDFERQSQILQKLNSNSVVKVKDMISILKVSESTVRRDFEELVSAGKAEYVYGGIKAPEKKLPIYLPKLDDEKGANIKDQLCQKVSELIVDGMNIYIDGGTTFRTIMHYIKDRNVTVVTNNILMASSYEPSLEDNADVIIAGGCYDSMYYLTKGALASEKIQEFHFDLALIAAETVDIMESAVYVADVDLASVKKVAMKRSDKNILVAEGKKMHRQGLYRFADLKDFSMFYTDSKEDLSELTMEVVQI